MTFAALLRTHLMAAAISRNGLAVAAGCDAAYVYRLAKDGFPPPSRPIVLALAAAMRLSAHDTDRFLMAAGYATVTDWMSIALDAQQRLALIDQALVGVVPLREMVS